MVERNRHIEKSRYGSHNIDDNAPPSVAPSTCTTVCDLPRIMHNFASSSPPTMHLIADRRRRFSCTSTTDRRRRFTKCLYETHPHAAQAFEPSPHAERLYEPRPNAARPARQVAQNSLDKNFRSQTGCNSHLKSQLISPFAHLNIWMIASFVTPPSVLPSSISTNLSQ